VTPVRITRADPADLDRVAPLFDQYRQFYHQPADLSLAREFLEARLREGDSVIFLAANGAGACGFTQLYPVYASTAARPGLLWLLNDLFVSPQARGAGVGRALMQRALDHGIATGATGIFLQTARDNHGAQRLYEDLGFRRDDVFLVYERSLP
jgi:ribosomal protein S18 acetylase RimI-like enzyme